MAMQYMDSLVKKQNKEKLIIIKLILQTLSIK